MSNYIEIFENQKIEVSKNVNNSSLDEVKNFTRVSKGENYNQYQFFNSVGIMSVGDKTYKVNSKIKNFTDIFEISSRVLEAEKVQVDEIGFIYLNPSNIVELESGSNFWDILIKIFLIELDKVRKIGFTKRYTVRRQNQNFLKGRLVIKKQISKNIVGNKFFCQYNEQTYETKENLILYTALGYMYHMKMSANYKSDILSYLHNDFNIKMKINTTLSEWDFEYTKTLQNKHYAFIMQLLKLIINKQGVSDLKKGTNLFCDFLVKTDVLYEKYIAVLLRELLKEFYPDYVLKTQYDLKYISSVSKDGKVNFLKMTPDLVIFSKKSNVPIAVLDTKYKDVSNIGKLNNADFYQSYIYAQSLRVKYSTTKPIPAILLAHGNEPKETFRFNAFSGGSYEVHTAITDLSLPEEKIKLQLREVLEEIVFV